MSVTVQPRKPELQLAFVDLRDGDMPDVGILTFHIVVKGGKYNPAEGKVEVTILQTQLAPVFLDEDSLTLVSVKSNVLTYEVTVVNCALGGSNSSLIVASLGEAEAQVRLRQRSCFS